MPTDMDRETELILRENDLDPALITDLEGLGACHNVDVLIDGALDERFLVRSEYAREVVELLGPIYADRYGKDSGQHIQVDATHGYLGDPDDENDIGWEASGYLDDYYKFETED